MAAATSLLDEPRAWLDGVRPGLALYRGAVRVSTRLVEARDSHGPAGYSDFVAPRFGIILAGYSNGLWRSGICLVNGVRRKILEVGMQSAFVEIGERDKAGDEAVLLGDGLTEEHIADVQKTSPHEVIMRLSFSGEKNYA
jgi:alanine racemase